MSGDWIKINRSMLDSDIFSDHVLTWLWMRILLKANWKLTKIKVGKKQIKLEPGDAHIMVTEMAESIKVNHHKLRRLLDYLEKTERISRARCYRGVVVSVCNWDAYQAKNNSRENEMRLSRDLPENYMRFSRDLPENDSLDNPTISNRLQPPKKERRKERKKERILPPTPSIDLSNFYAHFTDEAMTEFQSVGLMISKKDFIWADGAEVDPRAFFISCQHLAYDLRTGALDGKGIKSNVAWLKGAVAKNGVYYSEGYAQKQANRASKEKAFTKEFS